MSIRNKNDIRVYSELPFQINLVGQHREYVFPASRDGEPTMNYVDWADIEYAHSRGNTFSNGLLIFNEEEQEEIYRELGIRDWRSKVWFDKDIVDAIENPTLEKMQRVINVKDSLTFERIRGKVVMYINRGKDVSQKVVNIVDRRYLELQAGIYSSKITIRPVDVDKSVSADEVEELKKQLSHMQKLMEQMAANQTQTSSKDSGTGQDKEDDTPKKIITSKSPKRTVRKATAKK